MGKKKYFFMGVGLDGDDGHKRITKAKDYAVVGGSKETHEMMQEKGAKLSEGMKDLERRHGDNIDDRHIADLLREVVEE